MKQITVLCNTDLSGKVYDILARSGVEGFVNVPRVVGNRPGAAAAHGRYPRWEAEMFLAAVEPHRLEPVVGALRELAGKCGESPCLRVLVSSLDAVY
jgi:hypothetical protein